MIVFARHGETAPNREGRILGRAADPELTGEGRRQAEALARLLRRDAPVAVLTSPLLRARETAEVIAAACNLDVAVDERLVEIDWGAWEGRSVTGIGSSEMERFRAEAGTAPEGESLAVLGERVGEFCAEALEGGLVVAVTHVSPIKAAVAWTLGVPDDVAFRMFVALASVTRVDRRSRGPILVSFNETAHLLDEPGEHKPEGP